MEKKAGNKKSGVSNQLTPLGLTSRRERISGGIVEGTMKTFDASIIILLGYFYLIHVNKRFFVCFICLL